MVHFPSHGRVGLRKRLLHFMHMIRVFFWHTLNIPCAVDSGKCLTPSKYLSAKYVLIQKKLAPYVKSFKKLIFGGPFGQARGQNGILGGKKKFRWAKKFFWRQSNVFRYEMHEILLKIKFN